MPRPVSGTLELRLISLWANVSAKELEALQTVASDLLKLTSTQLDTQVEH